MKHYTKAEEAVHKKLASKRNPTRNEWLAFLRDLAEPALVAATTDDIAEANEHADVVLTFIERIDHPLM
jgi:hypothetical protein